MGKKGVPARLFRGFPSLGKYVNRAKGLAGKS